MNPATARHQKWFICAGLAAAVLAAYLPLWHCQFVSFDDGVYVTSNEMVRRGISWPGIVWALSTFHGSNWHPLTWISHMVDVQLYGMNPAGHHLTSLLLHAANSILLFLLLQRMTAARWPSALVAALFALHPLHVESVAWVAERKDVLSTFFWMLAAAAYIRFVEEQTLKSPKARTFYIASIVLFGLALLAKPMVVTLPFVFLLLDYWPLRRCDRLEARLLVEKIPFFILAAASCVITVMAQRAGGSVLSLAVEPLGTRLQNVPVAYALYLERTFWPVKLAAFYPIPTEWPVGEVAGATVLLALITGWVVWRLRTQRFLAVGWFWFLGTLVPVIGLLQVGTQSSADRYDYVPSIGLFVMIVWAAREWLSRLGARAGFILGGLVVTACLALTPLQVQSWTNDESLWRHALAVTENNAPMENNLGKFLLEQGRVDEALPHLVRAVALAPNNFLPHYNLGHALLAKGKVAESLAQFDAAVSLQPNDPAGQYDFGRTLVDNGLPADAIPHLEKAVQLRPDAAEFHSMLGDAYRLTGRAREAISQYEQSLKINPQFGPAVSSLAWMLATTPDASIRDGGRAVQLALLANKISAGQDPKSLGILAAAYAETGNFAAATTTAERALQAAGGAEKPALADALREQLALYRAGKPYRGEIKN